eukprot:TRINITY_DN68338_c0_g1_i1.p1 TRINITY_DN68338_c0_g1~~TRINITY_DN68338_c0_g1_i1.p1  ORF type:complete len:296 (-),score=13.12 TRINITY_DN68338_c0_g1_i1:41-928(-)
MAEGQMVISRAVTSQVFHDAISDEQPAGVSDERRPLVGQGSRHWNRELVRTHQQTVAQRVFERSPKLITFFLVVITLFLLTMLVMYIYGWFIWIVHTKKSCDSPLATWLFITQLFPAVQRNISVLVHFAKCVNMKAYIVNTLRLFLLTFGAVCVYTSKSCSSTNPPLYKFCTLYMALQCVGFVCHIALPRIAVALVLYGLRHDWFPINTGASRDTIKKIATVQIPGSIDPGCDDADWPEECCCCWECWDGGRAIKKTPCGHYFHEDCLGKWLHYSTTCPLCRADLEEAVNGAVWA